MDTLCIKCERALAQTGLTQLVIAGGVSANRQLRQQLDQLAQEKGYRVYMPRIEFCTDNAAMIAYAGCLRLQAGQQNDFSINVRPRWPLSALVPLTEPVEAI